MAVLINGNGNEAIYAQQDADWFASIMGNQTAITGIGNKFAASLLDANTIGVSDGVIITQEGRRIQLDVNEIDSFDIPAGGQGETNYYIIGYHLVTGDLSEQYCETFVRLMDNDTDTIPEDTFRGGADEVFVSLYRVTQDDLVITDMELLLPEITNLSQLNNSLTANTKKFQFAYDNTKQKYGYTIDNEFYPFSSGTIYLGEYSANATIDVSALGATSADQFLLVPNFNGGGTYFVNGAIVTSVNTIGTLSLSNNVLTITLPSYSGHYYQSGTDFNFWDTKMPCKLYYVGDIESV